MMLEELEADDDAIRRLQALDAVNPLFEKARRQRRADEAEQDKRIDALWPAQHPFEYDPKKPSLHP